MEVGEKKLPLEIRGVVGATTCSTCTNYRNAEQRECLCTSHSPIADQTGIHL